VDSPWFPGLSPIDVSLRKCHAVSGAGPRRDPARTAAAKGPPNRDRSPATRRPRRPVHGLDHGQHPAGDPSRDLQDFGVVWWRHFMKIRDVHPDRRRRRHRGRSHEVDMKLTADPKRCTKVTRRTAIASINDSRARTAIRQTRRVQRYSKCPPGVPNVGQAITA